MSSKPPPDNQGAEVSESELLTYREGMWPGSEEQLDKRLVRFSSDNIGGEAYGFIILRHAIAASRFWHVRWRPCIGRKVLPNGELNPNSSNAYAVIRSLDTPRGVEVDIRARSWRRKALHTYLDRLVETLKRSGFTVESAPFDSKDNGQTQPHTSEKLSADAIAVLSLLFEAGSKLRYGAIVEGASLNKSQVQRALAALKGHTPPLVRHHPPRQGYSTTAEGEKMCTELRRRADNHRKN